MLWCCEHCETGILPDGGACLVCGRPLQPIFRVIYTEFLTWLQQEGYAPDFDVEAVCSQYVAEVKGFPVYPVPEPESKTLFTDLDTALTLARGVLESNGTLHGQAEVHQQARNLESLLQVLRKKTLAGHYVQVPNAAIHRPVESLEDQVNTRLEDAANHLLRLRDQG